MAVTSFIPQLWAGALLAHLDKVHVVANLVNRDYEGEIRQYGSSVKINQIGAINIKDYTVNTNMDAAEELSTTDIVLNIDKRKYFNFQIDDVDAAQVRGDLMNSAMQRASYALADATETDILKAIDGETGANKIAPEEELSSENIYKNILKMKTELDKQNVPTTGRNLIISPDTHALLLQANVLIGNGSADSEKRVINGFVGQLLGFDVYLSNNLSTLTNGKSAVAFVKEAVTFAEQIIEMEAYRPELRFADAVKGLNVYGVKVTIPKAIALLKDTP